MAQADTPFEQAASHWWLAVLVGLISIAAGILALAYEGITLLALGLVFGIAVLVWGTFSLTAAFEPGIPTSHAVVRVVVGIVAILAGLVLVVRPGASVLALLIAVSFWLIIAGVGDLAIGISGAGNRIVFVLLGLVSIAAGVIILGDPDIGLRTLAIVAGIMFIVRGVFDIAAGIQLHRLRTA
jgi:uncharacterized membrane protein HdeD (DUF308 family)